MDWRLGKLHSHTTMLAPHEHVGMLSPQTSGFQQTPRGTAPSHVATVAPETKGNVQRLQVQDCNTSLYYNKGLQTYSNTTDWNLQYYTSAVLQKRAGRPAFGRPLFQKDNTSEDCPGYNPKLQIACRARWVATTIVSAAEHRQHAVRIKHLPAGTPSENMQQRAVAAGRCRSLTLIDACLCWWFFHRLSSFPPVAACRQSIKSLQVYILPRSAFDHL